MTRVKEFPLPDLGEGLTEGEILKWLVAEGDMITLNQPIVEVETAKAAVEIPAKWAGKVTRIFHPEGATVEVGMPIIAIDTDPGAGDLPPSADLPAPSAASLAAVEIAPAEGSVEPGMIGGPAPGGRTAVLVGYGPRTTTAARRPRKGATTIEDLAAALNGIPVARPVLAKPPVRKLARDLGVDLVGLHGSGPSGSITRDDVQAAASGSMSGGTALLGTGRVDMGTVGTGAGQGGPTGGPGYASAPGAPLLAPATAPVFGPGREQRIPIKGVRKLTAENMVASAFSAPHVTEFLTVDVTRSMRALARLRERPDWRGVRLSPLLLVAKAVLLAVRRHPMVNSAWSESTAEIVVKEYVNLGIAAATPRGLLVPNIKDAGRLSLRELADAMTALIGTAKDGRTAPAEMSGGTFTITNVGVFGVDTGTPILAPGEAAILCFGAVRPMPWVHKGKVTVRDVTTLSLSFDHRIIDGELGSRFLSDVGAFLADPEACLLAWA